MMNHSDAQPLSGEELMGLIYGEEALPAERQKHLDQCTICQQELATYQQLHGRMRTQLYRALCPDSVQLHYYCLDMTPEEERTRIASHLLDCIRCTDEVAEIRHQQATFDPFPPVRESLASTTRRLIATLVMPQMQPSTRELIPSVGWPRQYRAESINISLHLSWEEQTGEAMLIGILTSTLPTESVQAFEGVPVELYSAPEPPAGSQLPPERTLPFLTTQIDDTGNILLEPLPSGEYTLLIRLPDREVLIERLTIQHL